MASTSKPSRGVSASKGFSLSIDDDYPEVRMRPTSRSFVVPAAPTKQHWLPLSNLDRIVNPSFSSVILFYGNLLGTSRPFQDVTRSLKDSLARALVHFYPLAGRLALREDGQVDIHCNDAGAVFIEAFVDAELSAVGEPRPMSSLSGLAIAGLGSGPLYIPDQTTSLPALVVQVTNFRCGSVAIAANWHHTVADVSSGCHFMKSWAEIGANRELSLHPNHDRLLLKPREKLDASLINGCGAGELDKLVSSSAELTEYQTLLSESAVLKSFHVRKSAVDGIQERVGCQDDNHEGGCFTAVESVSAHLWQQLTRARTESGDDGADTELHVSEQNATTRFFLFVDGRRKLDLPPGYFGNVVCSACAVGTVEELLNKPLAHAASLIRNAIRSISGDYFRSLIDWVEVHGSSTARSNFVLSMGHDVVATFWTFFPLYDVDFGWGRPSMAVRNSPPRPLIDGIVMLPSPEGPDSLMALLNLNEVRMSRLRRQPSFEKVYVPVST